MALRLQLRGYIIRFVPIDFFYDHRGGMLINQSQGGPRMPGACSRKACPSRWTTKSTDGKSMHMGVTSECGRPVVEWILV